MSLAEAREQAAEARRLVSTGVDAVHHRRARRASSAAESAQTFKALAEEWLATKDGVWSASYADGVRSALAANLYPHIGAVPVRQITVPIMREALLPMERRGTLVVLAKTRMWASGVFRYAIATGRAEQDPAAPLRGTFKAHKPKNFPALTKAEELGAFLAAIETYDGGAVTRAALKLLALTFVRTAELRGAEWSEIDLEKASWNIPAERMKMRSAHLVPLSRQRRAAPRRETVGQRSRRPGRRAGGGPGHSSSGAEGHRRRRHARGSAASSGIDRVGHLGPAIPTISATTISRTPRSGSSGTASERVSVRPNRLISRRVLVKSVAITEMPSSESSGITKTGW